MTRKIYFLAAAAALAASPATGAAAEPLDKKTQARIDRILKRTPLIDGHNDIAYALFENHRSSVANLADDTEAWPKDALMTDIERLRRGRVGGQFWSVYIDGEVTGDEAVRRTIEQIDIVKRMIAAYPRDFAQAYTARDFPRLRRVPVQRDGVPREVDRHVRGLQVVIREERLDHMPLVTEGQDKFGNAVRGVDFHDVPENRPTADFHHWLGTGLRFLHQPGSIATGENHSLAKLHERTTVAELFDAVTSSNSPHSTSRFAQAQRCQHDTFLGRV